MLSKSTRLFKLQLGAPFSRALASGSPVVTATSVQPRLLHSFLSLSPIRLRRLSDSPRYPITNRPEFVRRSLKLQPRTAAVSWLLRLTKV